MSNTAKSFDILPTILSILHNYFNSPIKLYLDQYLAEFVSIYFNKTIFPCIIGDKSRDNW